MIWSAGDEKLPSTDATLVANAERVIGKNGTISDFQIAALEHEDDGHYFCVVSETKAREDHITSHVMK